MLNVRAANAGDSEDIFNWRNDELTRQMSHTTDFVKWYEHSRWFASSLANDKRLLLICEDGKSKTKIGIVRFDIDSDRALISFNLFPRMRGIGLAKKCLSSAIGYFKTSFAEVSSIDAEIKSQNSASKASFEGVGFVFKKESDNVLLLYVSNLVDDFSIAFLLTD